MEAQTFRYTRKLIPFQYFRGGKYIDNLKVK